MTGGRGSAVVGALALAADKQSPIRLTGRTAHPARAGDDTSQRVFPWLNSASSWMGPTEKRTGRLSAGQAGEGTAARREASDVELQPRSVASERAALRPRLAARGAAGQNDCGAVDLPCG